MSTPGSVLENHTLVVRDGRILDILPSALAAERYTATVLVQRPTHLVMPGLINTYTHAATSLFRGFEPGARSADFAHDGAMAAIAEMLTGGTTCFADRYDMTDATARAAALQGMRAVIGLRVSEKETSWAATSADYVTRALRVRDEYKGHPLITTAFAPDAPGTLSDATFSRIATLADELDAGILIDLHATEVHGGPRPIERLWQLGLLTPALNAGHMTHVSAADIDLARRTGISLSLCPQADLKRGEGLPDFAALTESGLRLGLGSGGGGPCQDLNLWGEMKLFALSLPRRAWAALAAATRGGAESLGLDAEVGTLEPAKWADLCCLDLSGPTMQPIADVITQIVFSGGRDLVSDVWVAGRQLVADRELTRLDWISVSARANRWVGNRNVENGING